MYVFVQCIGGAEESSGESSGEDTWECFLERLGA